MDEIDLAVCGNTSEMEAELVRRRGRLVFKADLPDAPLSVRDVRRAAVHKIADHPNADMAELVISELASNAVIHAGCPCVLSLYTCDSCLLIQVRDKSDDKPVIGPLWQRTRGSQGAGYRSFKLS